jgi:Spy/CpxP family protein refolding chaperone
MTQEGHHARERTHSIQLNRIQELHVMKAKLLLILALLAAGSGVLLAQTSEREFPQLPPGMTGHRMPGEREYPMMGPGMTGHNMPGQGGMMGQGGMPGMMGSEMMGTGMMGASPGMLALDPRVPPEKRDQIRELHLSMIQTMTTKMAELQNQRLAMMKAIHAFPIDQAAAKNARESMQRTMGDMMSQRLETMAKVQQILGKELWEQVHPEWFGPRGTEKEGMMQSR